MGPTKIQELVKTYLLLVHLDIGLYFGLIRGWFDCKNISRPGQPAMSNVYFMEAIILASGV